MDVVQAMRTKYALTVIDARNLESETSMKKLDMFLRDLFLWTHHVRVILVCPAEQNFSFNLPCFSTRLCLDPLDLKSSVLLFGNYCDFVLQGHISGVKSPDDLAKLLVPEASAIDSQRTKEIFGLIGNGIPGKIRTAAQMEAKYNELIRMGIPQLEEKILFVSEQLHHVPCTDTARVRELENTLNEFEELRHNLPTLCELEQKHAELIANRNEREIDPDILPEMQSLGTESSSVSKGSVIGVEFSGANMDERAGWTEYIIKSKRHIEKLLDNLLRYGDLVYGETSITVERIQSNGRERTAVNLDCEIELREDLPLRDDERVREICRKIARFLRRAGATEDELEDLMIGAAYKGSLVILLEAPRSAFFRLFSEFVKGGKQILLSESDRLSIVAIAPAFLVTGPFSLLQEKEECCWRSEEKPDAVLWKEQDLSLIIPTAGGALHKLMTSGVRNLQDDNEGDWKELPSILPMKSTFRAMSFDSTDTAVVSSGHADDVELAVGRLQKLVSGAVDDTTLKEVQEGKAESKARDEKILRVAGKNLKVSEETLEGVTQLAGQLCLRWQWKRPKEIPNQYLSGSIGRRKELEELHRRLLGDRNPGTSAALRGQPGIGKTVLAALYANQYGIHYPGGVLWLDVGPQVRTAEDAGRVLQRMAQLCYGADIVLEMKDNEGFSPELVRNLLSCDPESPTRRRVAPLLVIFDDVWFKDVLAELKKALPNDSVVILTTRDRRVAFALEEADSAIQPIEEVSMEDAVTLLQSKATGLEEQIAKQVAHGLGYHPQALALAAGALSTRRDEGYEDTARDLLERVANGTGFGSLPLLDEVDQNTNVEVALKYSYDYLGEKDATGHQFQQQFRALGVFAQEADFSTAAVAAVLGLAESEAKAYMLLLDALSLASKIVIEDGTETHVRWQQHAILRAYELSLRTTADVELHWPVRHADHYLDVVQSSYNSKPQDFNRVEQEYKQIEHAFDWCQEQSPDRVLSYTTYMDDFLRIRGRTTTLKKWLCSALTMAELTGNTLSKANTLLSLGDLELQLGNVDAARQHYDNALPLFETVGDQLAKPTPFGVWAIWSFNWGMWMRPASIMTMPCPCTRP